MAVKSFGKQPKTNLKEKKIVKKIKDKAESKPKHVKFDDDGATVELDDDDFLISEPVPAEDSSEETQNESAKRGKKREKKKGKNNNQNAAREIGKRWFEFFEEHNTNGELVEMKDAEITELNNLCKSSFEKLFASFEKDNPSDAKWLKTALHKGTLKDRANAGALLVQSNPIANLETLETLIGFSKKSNNGDSESIDATAQLFMNALLPSHRKLISIALRGADWKALKKNSKVDETTKTRIFCYWHFEAELKELYFEFLRNVQTVLQSGKDAQKGQAILCTYHLLLNAPEKEQLLLSNLVNKLGDPTSMIASKALYYIMQLAFKHPAMCGVITAETEKFLFRNNISEVAQHFALCTLAEIAVHADVDVCIKMVEICFAFFKIVIAKGTVDTKIMQAILRCLKHSVSDVVKANRLTPGADNGLLSKDSLDTIYRVVHHTSINISLQTLSLLLQIAAEVDDIEGNDRFYNALYAKMLDPSLPDCGNKIGSTFLHIVHRAIYVDRKVERAQALIKRLLQVSLHFPPQMACGSLIIVNKLFQSRPELKRFEPPADIANAKSENGGKIKVEREAMVYDPHHRSARFAGAQFVKRTELLKLAQHYHPTVRVFAQNLIDEIPINFYGDPLRDFSLMQFLERFAFKNPKKSEANKELPLIRQLYKRPYKPFGSRGLPIKQLTEANCTEDERFIFEFMQKKRENQSEARELQPRDVDDDEFEAYLDGLVSKKKKKNKDDDLDEDEDEEIDFLSEYKNSSEQKPSQKKRKNDDEEGSDDDWDKDDDDEIEDDGDSDDADAGVDDELEDNDSDAGSVSLDGEDDDEEIIDGDDDDDDDDDESDIFENESDEEMDDSEGEVSDPEEPKSKKLTLSGKDFQRKLKNTNDVSSLFAAADDFSEMLEETGKSKKHGTLGEIFNQDKSSQKQMDWEENRMNKRSGKPNKKFQRRPVANKKEKKMSQGQRKRGEISKKSKPPMKKRK